MTSLRDDLLVLEARAEELGLLTHQDEVTLARARVIAGKVQAAERAKPQPVKDEQRYQIGDEELG